MNIIQGMAKFFSRISHALHKSPPKEDGSKTTPGAGALINGRYRLEAEIGRGGMGIVYRAHDIPNDRDVAVKVINTAKANALTRQQFLHEAEITAKFHHPHIVGVYETGTMDPGEPGASPFMVMELVEGTSLGEIFNLTYARILEITKQICDALHYIHQQGYVYRDLKPGNVLIEKQGFQYFVKLIDLGLARPRGMANLSQESSVAGTLFYLAPELIAGKPADIPSDLYALGATLYEMITGRVPFSDFDEQTILSQHIEASVAPPSQSRNDVPPALESTVLRLLKKDPAERFASAQEVCEALEQIVLAQQSGVSIGNLPSLPAGYFVDENAVTQVKQSLVSHLLVTLLDGNETIALAAGQQLNDLFSDGVWWVDFRSVENPSLVLGMVTSTLGLAPNPDRPLTASLIEFLREKNLLLILVHGDPVMGACVQLIETILHTCPEVHFLVTSQQPLHVFGEKLVHQNPQP